MTASEVWMESALRVQALFYRDELSCPDLLYTLFSRSSVALAYASRALGLPPAVATTQVRPAS